MAKKYNLSQIMNKAWTLFKQSEMTFADCLRISWAETKEFINAIADNVITEEVHTWYTWYQMGYEVIHDSKNVFQLTVTDPRTKKGTRVISFFTKSQVAPIVAE